MTRGIINSAEVRPSDAMSMLPESFQRSVVGAIKIAEPAREDQSPMAIRKATLKSLKATRRELIISLIAVEKEIFLTEEAALSGESPDALREIIWAVIIEASKILGRRSISLQEARDLCDHPEIVFETWVSELTTLKQEGKIFYDGGEHMVILKR